MPVSFPVSLPLSLPVSWQLPDGVVIWGFGVVLGLGHLLFLATVYQLLRRRRFSLLLVALATYGWALGSWASAADSSAAVRSALGGHETFVSLNLAAQAIFVGLTLLVIAAAWRRIRSARVAVRSPVAPPRVAPSPITPTAPATPQTAIIDPDAWLR